jgi:hypothetical protein
MQENFLDTAEAILRFKSSRDPLVRRMVITMIPTLAAYDTQTFTEHFLHKAMAHLLTQLDKAPERNFGKLTSMLHLGAHLILDSFYRHRPYCTCCGQ